MPRTNTQNNRQPIAFIDKTGYVTPWNGIMDHTLSGWYIYDVDDLKKALEQQKRLDEKRVSEDLGAREIKYYDAELKETTEEETPNFAREIFGADNAVPFLQLDRDTISEGDTPVTQVKVKTKKNANPTHVVKTVTVDAMHTIADNRNLTPEEMAEQASKVPTPNEILRGVMS